MKNRIIAVFLAFTVLVGSLSITKRANAAPAVVAGVINIGILAWEILDLMIKGEEPGIIVAIRTIIENGIDALTNPDSPFQQNFRKFWDDYGNSWQGLFEDLKTMYENGEIEIVNGKIELTYTQFQQLYDVAYSFVSNIGVELKTSYNYFAFDYTPSLFLPVLSLPTNDMYYKSASGQAYCLMYYNDNKAIFSDTYFVFRENSDQGYVGNARGVLSNFTTSGTGWFFDNISYTQLDRENWRFAYNGLNSFIGGWVIERAYPTEFCFVLENGNVTRQVSSSVNVSGFKSAIVSTTGDFGDFLQSLQSVKTVDAVASTLDDLSSVLPVDESPVLSIPVNPDLSVSIPDQVTVSVPGAKDIPISDYMNPVLTEVSVPSVWLTKFPFCIPYDFIRFLGFLAADPIPPVFRIPISTHPGNLEQWADNETIGVFPQMIQCLISTKRS